MRAIDDPKQVAGFSLHPVRRVRTNRTTSRTERGVWPVQSHRVRMFRRTRAPQHRWNPRRNPREIPSDLEPVGVTVVGRPSGRRHRRRRIQRRRCGLHPRRARPVGAKRRREADLMARRRTGTDAMLRTARGLLPACRRVGAGPRPKNRGRSMSPCSFSAPSDPRACGLVVEAHTLTKGPTSHDVTDRTAMPCALRSALNP